MLSGFSDTLPCVLAGDPLDCAGRILSTIPQGPPCDLSRFLSHILRKSKEAENSLSHDDAPRRYDAAWKPPGIYDG